MRKFKLSKAAFGMLKCGMFLVISMLTSVIFYINTHSVTSDYFKLKTGRLMLEESLGVLVVVLIAAFFLDAASKNNS